MNKVPLSYNEHFSSEGQAPNDSSKVNTRCGGQDCQCGGGYSMYGNSHSRLQWSPLPCKDNRVDYQPNKPTCFPWNTPQCGYGCGACTYPYGYATEPSTEEEKAPNQEGGSCCGMGRGCGCPYRANCPCRGACANRESCPCLEKANQSGGDCGANSGYKSMCQNKLRRCNGNGNDPRNQSNIWYSQQCGCGNCGDCAGSGTVFGCGCGGSGCKDCATMYQRQANYRHMLTGTNYPFC